MKLQTTGSLQVHRLSAEDKDREHEADAQRSAG